MNVANQKEYHRKWYQKNKKRLRVYKRKMMQRLRKENPEKYAQQSRQAKRRLRLAILEAFGRKCICGFDDIRALTLDHKNNNGSQERKLLGERGVYVRALKPENRRDYQILCMNCQFIKRSG